MNTFFSEKELRRFFTDSKVIQDGEEAPGDNIKDDFYPADKLIESPHTEVISYKELQEMKK